VHPPKVSDELVRALISELTVHSRPPSGAALRAALMARFGGRGGVSRIYRLLKEQRESSRPTEAAKVEELRGPEQASELERLRLRAERAEAREEAHQLRWASEVDQLRTRVALLEPLAQQARAAVRGQELLAAQLRAAHARIAVLEEQLLALREGS
jgi:hypothetical protein